MQLWDTPAMETPDEIGIEDISMLTDADWAEINQLSRAYQR